MTTIPSDPAPAAYLLDNEHPATAGRFSGLSAAYDPVTVRQLQAVGVGPGWHCLEVGAGNGSVARWLSDRVGTTGRVVAADVDTRWLPGPAGPNLEVRRIDLRTDELPEAAFDLVHARLVLLHLPQRSAVLDRLVRSLRPGGWLVTSEFDGGLRACSERAGELDALVDRVHGAFEALLRSRGADTSYGHRLYPVFRAAGLVDVHVDGHVEVAVPGSPAVEVLRANVVQAREEAAGRGWLSQGEVDRYLAALADPAFACVMPVLFSARGRRPSGVPAPRGTL